MVWTQTIMDNSGVKFNPKKSKKFAIYFSSLKLSMGIHMRSQEGGIKGYLFNRVKITIRKLCGILFLNNFVPCAMLSQNDY